MPSPFPVADSRRERRKLGNNTKHTHTKYKTQSTSHIPYSYEYITYTHKHTHYYYLFLSLPLLLSLSLPTYDIFYVYGHKKRETMDESIKGINDSIYFLG
jgi:hypothetical protein